jgi:hypothetical protein
VTVNEYTQTPLPGGHPVPPQQGGPPPISQPFPTQPHTRYPQPGQYPQPQPGQHAQPGQYPQPDQYAQAGQYPQPSGAPERRSRARVVLVVAAVLAFAVAGLFTGLYVAASGDRDAAVALLDERKAQLAAAQERLGTAEEAASAARDRNSGLEAQGTALQTCVDAVQHYLWDSLTDAETTVAIDAMFTACE